MAADVGICMCSLGVASVLGLSSRSHIERLVMKHRPYVMLTTGDSSHGFFHA